jgi:transposase InsO family protein
LFDSLDEVRTITNDWIENYNLVKPYAALGNLISHAFAAAARSS